MATLFGVARIGRDTEIRYLQNGDAVANIALAFSYGKKGPDGKRPTQWADGSLYGKRAESMAPYLVKGQQVGVTLEEVHIRTYQKQDGTEGYSLSGRVAAIEFAGSAPSQQQPQQYQQAAPAQQQARRAPQSPPPGFDEFEDDAPFN